jgi:cell pole-organizing protein PopZ
MSQNPNSMEDILTSIRTSVEEETAKVAGGEGAAEEVLTLSDADILGEAGAVGGGAPEDELIDIDAFANSGEAKPATGVEVGADPLGVNAPAPAAPVEAAPAAAPAAPAPAGGTDEVKAAEDEFDRLLAELETPPAPGAAPAAAPAPAPAVAVDEVVAEDPAPAPAPVPAPAAPAPVAPAPLPVSSGGRLELAAIQSVDGLQVAFPAEVLAAALRPLVKDWVAENLPAIVERLVKDEIAKISQE